MSYKSEYFIQRSRGNSQSIKTTMRWLCEAGYKAKITFPHEDHGEYVLGTLRIDELNHRARSILEEAGYSVRYKVRRKGD